jgi:iron complex transport system substrate-binding protein
VLALRPGVVLAWASGTPQATIERLEAVGLRVVTVPTYRFADGPAALRLVGRLAGTPAVAEAAARRFDDEIDRLRRGHAGASVLTVFIQIEDQPLFTVGGRNVFAELAQVAPQIDVEAVLARNPQVILSTDDTVADPAAMWRRWPQLQSVRAATIYPLPSDLVARATPRLAQGVAATCRALEDARRRLAPRPAGS